MLEKKVRQNNGGKRSNTKKKERKQLKVAYMIMHSLGNNRSALSSVNKAIEEKEKQIPRTGKEKKRRKWNGNYISCICRWDFEKKKQGRGRQKIIAYQT